MRYNLDAATVPTAHAARRRLSLGNNETGAEAQLRPAPRERSGLWLVAVGSAALLLAGCKPSSSPNSDGGPGVGAGAAAGATIQVKGSDTMVNLAIAWAEEYKKKQPQVSVEVAGGGSGQGLAALVRGTIDIAVSSRNIKAEEAAMAKKNTGKEPKEAVVGYDALAVYVHRDHPLEEINFEQLKEIFAEGGSFTKWNDLNATVPGCGSGEIIRVSRQSSSGTYEFFREHVLAQKDFKLGSRDMNGSKEVVELIANTPCAIGYSGMGYARPEVKMLKVSSGAGKPAAAPTVPNTLSRTYPISRSLLTYTLGEPEGEVKRFLDWCLSAEGQKVVETSGYVPLAAGTRAPLQP
jgi:phosphate transport system substrate-binding protein